MMQHNIDIQNQLEPDPSSLPANRELKKWANATLSELGVISDMTIRIVDEVEIQALNCTYRHKNTPTNVLSFTAEIPEEIDLPLLGDIIICASVVEKEAVAQHKKTEDHWAHMVIHGTLHLLGYDHVVETDAKAMERKEIEILANFGYPDPYLRIEDTAIP